MQIPLYERCIIPMCGRMVCVVLKDGTHHVGRLSSCRDGKIYLNEGQHQHSEHSASECSAPKTSKSKKSKKKSKLSPKDVTASGFGGYGPYGRPYGGGFGFGDPLAFDLGLIALLFLLFI